jgi:dihydrofolate synthase/folylpolyglutamate synthase
MRTPSATRRTTAHHERVIRWLDARVNYERTPAGSNSSATFSLGRMRRLLHDLGDPHLRHPVAHVAGTKGKGSTVAMLASILREAGHRVGSYLSPHVHRVEERIAVDGRPISTADFASAIEVVIPAVERVDASAARRGRCGPTWFEVMTAVAFMHFASRSVDIVVLETGIGGRLDATNVCHPLVTIITSIGLDHMKLLGPTITRITGEKAGIIKRGCPVISGATQPAARRVIAETAARRRAPLLQLGRDFAVRHMESTARPGVLAGAAFELERHDVATPRRYDLRLAGQHQAHNASLAVIAAEQLRRRGIKINDEAIRRGLSKATLPARIQTISTHPLVVVDAAHNVASMTALASTLRPVLHHHTPRVLVFAASVDKQIEAMLKPLAGLLDRVIVTRYLENPRAAPLDRLRSACAAAGLPRPMEAASPGEALRLARSIAGRSGLVLIAGSFFLAGEVGTG